MFCGIGITNAQLFEMSVQEYKRNKVFTHYYIDTCKWHSDMVTAELHYLQYQSVNNLLFSEQYKHEMISRAQCEMTVSETVTNPLPALTFGVPAARDN